MEYESLFQDKEDNLYEQINGISKKEEVLISEIPDIKMIPLNQSNIPKTKTPKNLLNKKRKDLFKCSKETKTNKNKIEIQNCYYNNKTNGDNNQNSIYKPLKYNKFDDTTELKSNNDLHYDKYGIPTFNFESLENQNYNLYEQFFNDYYPNLSEESSISNDIVISTFNYNSYKNENKNKYNINIVEPEFTSYNHILKIHEKDIGKIWSKEAKIFENKNDLNNTLKNGKIYQRVYILLSKSISYKAEKRKFDADGMINKIKTELQNSILNYINSFDEMKNNKIYTPKKNLINNKIGADFNLIYLKQKLYNILSNDSSEPNKNTNNKKIKKIKEQNPAFFNQYFCLTIQNCLDIFRYKEQNPHFKNKLVEFLNKEYIEFKDDITDAKDYIASLILLVYNFERFFYLRLKHDYKKREKIK